MKKSGENSKIDMRALFGGEPSEYEMRRARKLLGNGTALLSAEICYPHFTGVSGEAMDAFYSDVADRFFGFACGEAPAVFLPHRTKRTRLGPFFFACKAAKYAVYP